MSWLTLYWLCYDWLLKLSSASSFSPAADSTCSHLRWFVSGKTSLLFRHNNTWMANDASGTQIQTSLFFSSRIDLKNKPKPLKKQTRLFFSPFFFFFFPRRCYNHSSIVVWEFWHHAEVRILYELFCKPATNTTRLLQACRKNWIFFLFSIQELTLKNLTLHQDTFLEDSAHCWRLITRQQSKEDGGVFVLLLLNSKTVSGKCLCRVFFLSCINSARILL